MANLQVLESIIGDGGQHAVDIPRGSRLSFIANGDVEVRHLPAGPKVTWPAGAPFPPVGEYGQTVYLTAAVGTTVELMLV